MLAKTFARGWGVQGRLGRWKSVAALVAALVFFVQTSVTAFAVASQPMLDLFGNPLCITSMDGDAGAPADHGAALDCCVLGCSAAASDSLAPSVHDAIPVDYPERRVVLSTHSNLPVVVGGDRDPFRPRGPPLQN